MANNTIFDDVFRTMLEKMPELIIPLINEVFGTAYPADIPIEQQRNEHHTKTGEKITDSRLKIADKVYHIECQSTSDAEMVILLLVKAYRWIRRSLQKTLPLAIMLFWDVEKKLRTF